MILSFPSTLPSFPLYPSPSAVCVLAQCCEVRKNETVPVYIIAGKALLKSFSSVCIVFFITYFEKSYKQSS